MGILQKTGLWQKMKFTEQNWLEVVVWHRLISPNQDEVGGNWGIVKLKEAFKTTCSSARSIAEKELLKILPGWHFGYHVNQPTR